MTRLWWYCLKYRVIHKSLRYFRPLWKGNRDYHAEGERVNRGRDTPNFCYASAFPARAMCWLLRTPDKRFSHTLHRLCRWPRPTCSFRSAQAATLLEFLVPLTNCFVRTWFCVVHDPKRPLHGPKRPLHSPKRPLHGPKRPLHGPKPPLHGPKPPLHGPKPPVHGPKPPLHGPKRPLHGHNWLSFGKFKETGRFLIPCPRHLSSRLPHSGATCKYPAAPNTQKKRLG
jgi:hypothetical protein